MSRFEIEKARAVPIEAELARRGVPLQGRGPERAGPCPACGGADRFSINIKKQVWNCRGCLKGGGDAISLVEHLDGIDFRKAVIRLTGEPVHNNRQDRQEASDLSQTRPDDEEGRRRAALRIWAEAKDPRGTFVETYLKSRMLDLPDEAANEAIRSHGRCKFGAEWHPAMICLVRDIITNKFLGVHRTALNPDRTAITRDGKTCRMSLGSIVGGAIKLDPDEDVTQGICIGEGVETCLAGRQMGFRPVWSVLSTGGVAGFPILPGVDGLHIFRENDANGASQQATEACARRRYEAGRDVVFVDPDTAKDLNDELREAAK